MVYFTFTEPAHTEIYTLSLHDALPIYKEDVVVVAVPQNHVFDSAGRKIDPHRVQRDPLARNGRGAGRFCDRRSEEHTSELQSLRHLVCRLLLEKKKIRK